MSSNEKVIYLDNHASTPCDPRVVETMMPFLTSNCANPSNALHALGRQASEAVEHARHMVARLIGAQPIEIVFTGSATESNNLAILGVAQRAYKGRNKLLISPIEHKSVLETCRHLSTVGFEVQYLPVDSTGTVDVNGASDLVDESTLFVCVQAANNEIGTIQPIAAIAELAHSKGAVVICDAAQAVGKVAIQVDTIGVDFLSISGHKMYGPKGVGALYVRGGASSKRLSPILYGGGHERGLRPGTINVPGVVGLGKACELSLNEMADEAIRVRQLRDSFEELLLRAAPEIRRNGSLKNRLPGNSSLTFPGVEADALLLNVPQLALGTNSACSSGTIEPSYVLVAIGMARDLAFSTVRVGLGRFTTEFDIDTAANLLAREYHRLRKCL